MPEGYISDKGKDAEFVKVDSLTSNDFVTASVPGGQTGMGNANLQAKKLAERTRYNFNNKVDKTGDPSITGSLSITEDLNVGGSVGIGTTSPNAMLGVGGAGSEKDRVFVAPMETEYGNSIRAEATAIGGTAIYGTASCDDGAAFGVKGICSAPYGCGVHALAGGSRAEGAMALLAQANKPATWAGYFIGNVHLDGKLGIETTEPAALLAVGGSGSATDRLFVTMDKVSGNAIRAEATAVGGTAIYGMASCNEGSATGVKGISSAPNGYGVYAQAGGSEATGGIGLFAKATGQATWAGYFDGSVHVDGNVGIDTKTPQAQLAVGGSGREEDRVFVAPMDVPNGNSIRAEATAVGGTAIYGMASCNEGSATGVKGISSAPNGYGVYAQAGGNTAEGGMALFAQATSPATWAGYFVGDVHIEWGSGVDAEFGRGSEKRTFLSLRDGEGNKHYIFVNDDGNLEVKSDEKP